MAGDDGGLWALGGYLYQIIGTLGIAASAENLKAGIENKNESLQGLLTLVNNDRPGALIVEPEKYNEDVLLKPCGLRSHDRGVLVQFKFSRKVPVPKIGRAELEKILKTFKDAVQSAKKNGVEINACVLITNKSFSTGGTAKLSWDEETTRVTYELRSILNFTQPEWIEQLKQFARRYGSLDADIIKGNERLIGIVTNALGGRGSLAITSETLLECFTGSKHTRPIAINDLHIACIHELEEVGKNLRVDAWNFMPVQRDASKELVDLVHQRALIGIHGNGGCGKSILLWQFLWEQREKIIYKIGKTDDITDHWIHRLVNIEWRNLLPEQCPVDDIEQAICRIVVANPNLTERPLFWLGLDGLDENIDSDIPRIEIKTLIKLFWRYDQQIQGQPGGADAVLLITCRNEKQLMNYLDISYDRRDQFPAMVNVTEFSEEERAKCIRQKFPDRIVPFPDFLFDRFASSSFLFSTSKTLALSINPVVLQALAHPVTWRSLLNLDIDIQKSVLDGEPTGLQELAKGIIDWFGYKLNLRHPSFCFTRQELIALLADIATGSNASEMNSNNVWINNAALYRGRSIANELFVEAQLAGLIEIGSYKEWYWRHPFVYQYLIENLRCM